VLDVLEARESSLQRVALPANADAGQDDTVVGAEDSAADVRGRAQARFEELAADGNAGRGGANACGEFASRHVIGSIARHGCPPVHPTICGISTPYTSVSRMSRPLNR